MLDVAAPFQASGWMPNVLCRFVRDFEALAQYLLLLKQLGCPRCGAVESLNRHSKLFGNDPDKAGSCVLRGQRVWCCPRSQRGGCGFTFCVFIAQVLPRHTLTAGWIWQWLLRMLTGSSLKAAVENLRPPFALETLYRLRRKLRQRIESLRALLCREQAPPSSAQSDPWLQTVEHLQQIFSLAECPAAQFQLHFQLPFLG